MIQLTPEELAEVRQILQRHLPGVRVKAFGSRVAGTARPFSDLDLVLMTDQPLDLVTLGTLRDAFSLSNLPFFVDLIDWATIDPAFRAIIAAQSVPIA